MAVINNQWAYELLRSMDIVPEQMDSWERAEVLIVIIVAALLIDFVVRQLLLKVIKRIVQRTKVKWDDVLFDQKVMRRLCHVIPPILVYWLLPVAMPKGSEWIAFIDKLLIVYIIAIILRFVNALLGAVHTLASQRESWQGKPLKGLMQTGQVITFLIAVILIVSVLIDQSPARLFAGLGASAAIMMLVFKDSIMGLVSGIQLSVNDMLRVGDWISMPKHELNGTVVEVTLNTVKVRNWDNTIVTVPPYLLVSDSFRNWRAMQESGARRITCSLNFDMSAVHFCTPSELDTIAQLSPIQQQVETLRHQMHDQPNTPLPTNLTLLRRYMEAYLRTLKTVSQHSMLMVRYLGAGPGGLPMELYFFANTTDWKTYETIQADVVDHLLAVVPLFGLHVFQTPSGYDVRNRRTDVEHSA